MSAWKEKNNGGSYSLFLCIHLSLARGTDIFSPLDRFDQRSRASSCRLFTVSCQSFALPRFVPINKRFAPVKLRVSPMLHFLPIRPGELRESSLINPVWKILKRTRCANFEDTPPKPLRCNRIMEYNLDVIWRDPIMPAFVFTSSGKVTSLQHRYA